MRAFVGAGFAAAALLVTSAAHAQTDTTVAADAAPTGSSVTFRSDGSATQYHVEATHTGGAIQCDTPCAATVAAGELRLRVTGAANFEQVLAVGEGSTVVTLHRRSDLLFYGGLIAAALGIAATVTALAINPTEGSNDLGPAALGIGGVVVAGLGFTAVGNAGSDGAEVRDANNARGHRSFAIAPSIGTHGGGLAAIVLF